MHKMGGNIETEIGIIHYWKDNLYAEKIKQGMKKSVVEASAIKEKLLLINSNSILTHKESGEPVIRNLQFPFISISHCEGLFAIYLASKEVGIDIQYFKNSLVKGKDYFLNTQELKLELTPLNLLLIWSAKEAYYKKRGGDIEDVKQEVTVNKIDIDKNKIWIRYYGFTEVLNLKVQKDYVLVWT